MPPQEIALGKPEAPTRVEEITKAERRRVDVAVGHVLKNLDWALQLYLRDECESEALMHVLRLRPVLARLPEAEREPYAVASLCHELFPWMKRELAQRWQVDPPRAAGSEDAPSQEPADEREADWDDRIGRRLSDVVHDENLARELRRLKALAHFWW